MSVKEGDTIVVWFSCGAASAVAAKRTLEKYGNLCTVRIVNNPIKEEHPDNQRFLKDVEAWLNHPIEFALNPKYPEASVEQVWKDRRYMAGVAGAPCTMILKKEARQHWEASNKHDWLVLGFTVEEKRRSDRFKMFERDNLLDVLIDNGITKEDCFNIIKEAGLELPAIYSLGYPNANCIGCVKSSSPWYWNLVKSTYPDVFEQRATLSRQIKAKLVKYKGKRIFLDELTEDMKGRKSKSIGGECGIFCEEK